MVADAEALLAAIGTGGGVSGPEEADGPQFDDTRRLDSVMAVAEALLDKYDDQHRVAAERFIAADEKTLKECLRIRKKKEEDLHEATEAGASKQQRGQMMKGLAQVNGMIDELEAKIGGGLEAYGYHPTHVAILNAQQKGELKAQRARIRQRRATAPKGGWRKKELADSLLKGSFDGRTVAFEGTESAQERLDRLLGVAKELEHPGIDDAGIETMKDYVRAGRFDNAHYIKIWSERLEEMGVQFEGLYPLPEPEPEPEQEPESEPAPEPEPEPEQEQPGGGAAGAVDMTVVFASSESDEERLDRLLAKATELEHPGIDPGGIETMKGFIAAGRFPHSHYIKMWSKRLEEMGVRISTGKAPAAAAARPEAAQPEEALATATGTPARSVPVPAPAEPDGAVSPPAVDEAPTPPPPPPPAQPTEEPAAQQSPLAVEMEIVFTDAQGDEERLDRLLAKATELEHPGIDPEGIETMKGFIAAGRFPHSHYIKMWSKRLEEMGVNIVQLTEPDISRLDSSSTTEGGGDGGSGGATAASGSDPAPAATLRPPNTLQVDVSPINKIPSTSGAAASKEKGEEENDNYTPMRAEALRLGTELDGVSQSSPSAGQSSLRSQMQNAAQPALCRKGCCPKRCLRAADTDRAHCVHCIVGSRHA
jgi:hypothetical protein